MNATREHFALPPLEEQIIGSYVGDGAAVLVRRAMEPETSEAVIQEALQFFLKYYRKHALENTRLYPGVREAVEELAAVGDHLAVLTNKPGRISTDIIRALGLAKEFARIYGADHLPAKKPDPIGIVTLMGDTGANSWETVMIGDSGVDVRTARNAGVFSCGVLWGFQPHTFEAFPPDVAIQEPSELRGAIDSLRKARTYRTN